MENGETVMGAGYERGGSGIGLVDDGMGTMQGHGVVWNDVCYG